MRRTGSGNQTDENQRPMAVVGPAVRVPLTMTRRTRDPMASRASVATPSYLTRSMGRRRARLEGPCRIRRAQIDRLGRLWLLSFSARQFGLSGRFQVDEKPPDGLPWLLVSARSAAFVTGGVLRPSS